MSRNQEFLNFDEFRQSEPMGDVVRQQREHFRDESAADALLRPGAMMLLGWVQWPDNSLAKVTA